MSLHYPLVSLAGSRTSEAGVVAVRDYPIRQADTNAAAG